MKNFILFVWDMLFAIIDIRLAWSCSIYLKSERKKAIILSVTSGMLWVCAITSLAEMIM